MSLKDLEAGIERTMIKGRAMLGTWEALRIRGLTMADLDRAFRERGDRPFSEQVEEVMVEMDGFLAELVAKANLVPGREQGRLKRLKRGLKAKWRGLRRLI